MLRGYLAGDNVVLSLEPSALPVTESPEPTPPMGYKAVSHWRETPTEIMQVWEMVPVEGTEQEAALQLSKMQFRSLPDEVAYLVRALADPWVNGERYYGPEDPSGMPQSRVRYEGVLYKCLQTNVSQIDWTPTDAPSLWAEILPGQEGNEPEEGYAEWEQPGAMNGYSTGDRVLHNGHLWESKQDDNVWEPGAVGAPWNDLGVYPPEE